MDFVSLDLNAQSKTMEWSWGLERVPASRLWQSMVVGRFLLGWECFGGFEQLGPS